MARARRVEPPEEVGKDTAPGNVEDLREPPKEPPKRPRAAAAAAPRRRPGVLEKKVTDQMVLLGMMVGAFDQYDGLVIIQGSERFAAATVKLAEESPRIRAAIERALEASAWGEFMVAAGMIAVPIAAHHGLIQFRVPSQLEPDGVPANQNGHATPPVE